MTQKIKSITIKLPRDKITLHEVKITNIDDLGNDQLEALKTLAVIAGNIEYEKLQTKYRKNGALVFAPEKYADYYWIFIEDEEGFCIEFDTWNGLMGDLLLLEQGYIFDTRDKAQSWADKLKIAYELKQRIVEAESEAENTLCYGRVWFKENRKDFDFQSSIGEGMLKVSHVAFDILMSDNVSNEHFKDYIEVFSL